MNIISEGEGKLFTDPDPDKARALFKKKSRLMNNKVMELKDAIRLFVRNGDYLAIGGFGTNRTPIAACHEILRQKFKNMGFAGHTATHDMQLLSIGEVFDRLDVAYVVGLEARGLSKCSRKYLESGKVQISEWTNYLLALRFQAAVSNVPFITARNIMGTDTFKYSAAKIVKCPYSGKKVVIVPALYPDISIIHVHESDVYGNARFHGISAADIELTQASKKVILTTERLVSNKKIRKSPHLTQIPYYLVDAVCHIPFGAYPGNMPGEYFSDEDHLKEWLNSEKDLKSFRNFVNKNIFNCKNHEDYVNLNGGLEKIKQLADKELLLNMEASRC